RSALLEIRKESARRIDYVLLGILGGGGHDLVDIRRFHSEAGKQFPHIDRKYNVELLGGVARKHVGSGGAAHGLDLAVEALIRNRVQLQESLLPFVQIRAIELADLGPDFEFGEIQQVRYWHAGLQRIAVADFGQLLSEID